MLNLLFISVSPKMGRLKEILQPQLKARVDVAGDFDYGLKDVLEKRPAAVVIQDHISGVAGESVVRHIQMLLGKESPRFILLHEGNPKAQAVKGLFEQCLDLAHPEEQLAEEILSVLKAILGEQWEKVVIRPKMETEGMAAPAVASPKDTEVANKIVDDLIADMQETPKTALEEVVPPVPKGSGGGVSSTTDEMAAMLIEATQRAAMPAAEQVSPPKTSDEKGEVKKESLPQGEVDDIPPLLPKTEAIPSPSPDAQPSRQVAAAKNSAEKLLASEPAPAPSAAPAPKPGQTPVHVPLSPANATASRANFHVGGKTAPESEPIPEELLLAFEANYRSQSNSWRNMAVVAGVVCLVGTAGWFIFSSHSDKLLSQKVAKDSRKKVPAHAGPVTAVKPAKDKTVTPHSAVPQAAAPIPKPAAVSNPVVPSFVPQKGRDNSYASKKPGWERFVDSSREVRIFREGSRIKAVQVMAGKGKNLDTAFLDSVLQELVGSSTYTLGAKERKQGYQGYLLQRGSVGKKAELIVYRKKTSNAIVAFVVSLD